MLHGDVGGAGGSGGGAESGPPLSCIPSQNVGAIADECGVFVSSSMGNDQAGKGTQASPYQTLAKAIAEAGGKPVYACGEGFTEALSIASSVTLFGALDCGNGWTYEPSSKTQLTAGADMIPMTLTSAARGTVVHDFSIVAADASIEGGSSIAVLDGRADLTLDNVAVLAGMGAAGAPGTAQTQLATPASAQGGNGTGDPMCNMGNSIPIPGGASGTNTCNGTMTNGGTGGKGLPISSGDSGGGGLPMMTPSNSGAGQTASASCDVGGQGAQGADGAPGTGARGIGDISSAGYQAPVATLGAIGEPGQGGGGGGAGRACDMNEMFAGPSGGGGGAGGCGGAPGNPGQSGGSSIGIVALTANLTLTNVTITANDGGASGPGGNGQRGANGGQPGNEGGPNACPGGRGGQGGFGGPGGGGAGGHSVGIAIDGGTLPDLGTTTITVTDGGTGGGGGDMHMTAPTKGDNGQTCKTLDFATPSSPTACAM
jgi:hypothetical protein